MLTPTRQHPYLVTYMPNKYDSTAKQLNWVYQNKAVALHWASALNQAHAASGGIATVYTACLDLPGQPFWTNPEIPDYNPGGVAPVSESHKSN